MEISKMLTLSTIHLSLESLKLLNLGETDMISYEKEGYGWFIYLGDEYFHNIIEELPQDIKRLAEVARENDCLWICLDGDGPVMDNLDVYSHY
ncbi:hypothetical protein M3202_19775 [Alkalihalobacillus oceani]|uniref:DUF5983 domain-containing protein n=1 Tax=Halalkalibacter oceani TaxID=1653776 RepID=A0A9X2IRC0_9BACI|nr:hypothetical protein [Halalkalibacter oceani]MCM3716287.1 hypothetical protein [Halalkalibacter oceani]